MSKKPKRRQSLQEILESTSDVLFPAEIANKVIAIDSQGCDGDTPLHVMIWRQDRYAAERLIGAGGRASPAR